MMWRWIMSWLPSRHSSSEKARHLDRAVAGLLDATDESTRVAEGLISNSKKSQERSCVVADEVGSRIEKQEARRQAREQAERDRGIASAIEDLLQLPGFGGTDKH